MDMQAHSFSKWATFVIQKPYRKTNFRLCMMYLTSIIMVHWIWYFQGWFARHIVFDMWHNFFPFHSFLWWFVPWCLTWGVGFHNRIADFSITHRAIWLPTQTIYPMKYMYSFVVLCYVVGRWLSLWEQNGLSKYISQHSGNWIIAPVVVEQW